MVWLSDSIDFPSPELARKDGILALGGDLSEKRLIHAYQNGIFPWFSEGEPIVWYSPEQRMVVFPNEFKLSKSMRKFVRKTTLTITENTAFEEVIFNCKILTGKMVLELGLPMIWSKHTLACIGWALHNRLRSGMAINWLEACMELK